MARKKIAPISPGEILLEEFLKPLGVSQNKLGRDIAVPITRINEIVNGKRAITPDTALRLARYFGTSAEVWLNLQQQFDLETARREREEEIAKTVVPLGR
jgi:addiction module HigA family antidote